LIENALLSKKNSFSDRFKKQKASPSKTGRGSRTNTKARSILGKEKQIGRLTSLKIR